MYIRHILMIRALGHFRAGNVSVLRLQWTYTGVWVPKALRAYLQTEAESTSDALGLRAEPSLMHQTPACRFPAMLPAVTRARDSEGPPDPVAS